MSILGTDVTKETADVFGKDLLFTDDLQMTSKGDYAVTVGIENLRLAIRRRLLVRPGEHKVRPNYGVGMGSFVKKKITKAVLDDLRHRIVDNLSQERRIDKVIAVDVVETLFGHSTGLTVTVRVQALGRDVRFAPFGFSEDV